MSMSLSFGEAVALASFFSVAANAVNGIEGQPLTGSFDPTKCTIDRSDDLFKKGAHGGPSCARCVTNNQCRQAYGSFQWFCCPYMKRCVNSSSMGCYDTADCSPRCFSESYPSLKSECSGCVSSFPDNWVKGCYKSDWANLVNSSGDGSSGSRPSPEPATNPQPSAQPEWCKYCKPDQEETKYCKWWKDSYNWCVGKASQMREKCPTTCGYCDGCSDSEPVTEPAPEPTPNPVPAPQPTLKPVARPVEPAGGDACARFNSDGSACHADAKCEWSWDLNKCISSPGTCESISSGKICSVTEGCKWDWAHECCITTTGPCQRIGSDGLACSKEDGCKWDWDLSSCVVSEVAPVVEVSTKNKRGKKGKGKGERPSDCGDARTNKACRMIDGCMFDKSSGVCLVKSAGGSNGASKDSCSKLKGKRCMRNSECYLEGGVCRQIAGAVSSGSSEVSVSKCSQLPRKQCKGSCVFDKTSRTCVPL